MSTFNLILSFSLSFHIDKKLYFPAIILFFILKIHMQVFFRLSGQSLSLSAQLFFQEINFCDLLLSIKILWAVTLLQNPQKKEVGALSTCCKLCVWSDATREILQSHITSTSRQTLEKGFINRTRTFPALDLKLTKWNNTSTTSTPFPKNGKVKERQWTWAALTRTI